MANYGDIPLRRDEPPCRCPYSCWWHGASLEEVNRILDGRQPMREEIADLERWWRL